MNKKYQLFLLAEEAIESSKDSKERVATAEKYASLIMGETMRSFGNNLWPNEYKEHMSQFLIESFSFDFLKMPSYCWLCCSYLKQTSLFLKSKWEQIFDYHLQKGTLVLKIFKKTFRIKLTPVKGFFVRHTLHFKNDVDLVYLWCDGRDQKWQRKRLRALKKANPNWTANGQDKSRSADNQELKYSLRSAMMYAPWIHKIYIITDGQTPKWFNASNKKIKIVDLKEIMPSKHLPCFNSNVIESYMYKIKGLSEYFLYACDDMFFNRPVTKDFFFSADGKPYARLSRMPRAHKIIDSPYLQTLVRMSHLYEEKTGKRYYLNSYHSIDAYTKSFFKSMEKEFKDNLKVWRQNQFRTTQDLQRILLLYQALGENTAILKYQRPKLKKHGDSLFFRLGDPRIKKVLSLYQPKLFCINDNEKATDIDRKKIGKLYQQQFPYRSDFEK